MSEKVLMMTIVNKRNTVLFSPVRDCRGGEAVAKQWSA